jgi:hypothetical protein
MYMGTYKEILTIKEGCPFLCDNMDKPVRHYV